jgi:hypothetical protein
VSRLKLIPALLLLVLSTPGCSCAARRARSSPSFPPSRQQIVDHVNAYIRSVPCSTWEWRCFSVLKLGERPARQHPECRAPTSGVSELCYESPQVDAAVHETMTENLTVGLELRPALQALWMLALATSRSDCDPKVEEKLRSLFWEATPLSGALLEAAGDRLGCRDCRSGACGAKVRRSEIRSILDRLDRGLKTWNGLWRGIPALRGQPGTDPVLAVAIARGAPAFEETPTLEAVEAELVAMGCAVGP